MNSGNQSRKNLQSMDSQGLQSFESDLQRDTESMQYINPTADQKGVCFFFQLAV